MYKLFVLIFLLLLMSCGKDYNEVEKDAFRDEGRAEVLGQEGDIKATVNAINNRVEKIIPTVEATEKKVDNISTVISNEQMNEILSAIENKEVSHTIKFHINGTNFPCAIIHTNSSEYITIVEIYNNRTCTE